MTLQRALIQLPVDAAASPAVTARLEEAEHLLRGLNSVSLDTAVAAARRGLAGEAVAGTARLAHELSPWVVQRTTGRQLRIGRSCLEAQVLALRRDDLARSLTAGDADFLRTLGSVCTDLGGRAAGLRTGPLRTAPDGRGVSIEFPHAGDLPGRLACIRRLICSEPAGGRIQLAAITMVALLNAHPFSDGNGRLSRLMFNFVVSGGRAPEWRYLPLYDAFSLSKGGFEIRLRQAEIHANWEPLFIYLCDVLEFIAAQFSSPAALISGQSAAPHRG